MMENYTDIINLSRPESKNRNHMSILNRAAQFAPFAALTGYAAAVSETGRLTEKKHELSSDEIAIIERRINFLIENGINEKIQIKYFKKDERKSGGKYLEIEDSFKKFDDINLVLTLESGLQINFEDLYYIGPEEIFEGDCCD